MAAVTSACRYVFNWPFLLVQGLRDGIEASFKGGFGGGPVYVKQNPCGARIRIRRPGPSHRRSSAHKGLPVVAASRTMLAANISCQSIPANTMANGIDDNLPSALATAVATAAAASTVGAATAAKAAVSAAEREATRGMSNAISAAFVVECSRSSAAMHGFN